MSFKQSNEKVYSNGWNGQTLSNPTTLFTWDVSMKCSIRFRFLFFGCIRGTDIMQHQFYRYHVSLTKVLQHVQHVIEDF